MENIKSQKQILIVDKDLETLEMYDELIPLSDFQLTKTRMATEAFDLIQKHQFDGLICDHELINHWSLWLLEEQSKHENAIKAILLLGKEPPSLRKFHKIPHVFMEKKHITTKLLLMLQKDSLFWK